MKNTATSFDDILQTIQSNDIKCVDFRFTDHLGMEHHITRHTSTLDKDTLEKGICFDSSSIKGWKAIERSDMVIRPDVSTAYLDLFTAQPTLNIVCDVIDVDTEEQYSGDPRRTARHACKYLKTSGIADTAYMGMEVEFFIFDDVRFEIKSNSSFYVVDSTEGGYNSGKKYDYGNNAYRPEVKGGYMPTPPIDPTNDIRSEILESFTSAGLKPILHHHEVANSQCEVGFMYDKLLKTSDNLQKCKYIIRNVLASYGRTATFMAKPINSDNGNGMHCHQSLWKDGVNLFAGDNKKKELSEMALYYIGGLLKHVKTINAFTNPTVNSYKRLIDGYEAPTTAAYSLYNRSAAIRIPYASFDNNNAARIEARFPDPTANPYYCSSAMLMAGLDGIENKIHPGVMANTNLFENSGNYEKLSVSLDESIKNLDKDRSFLLKGGVFTNNQIDAYIAIKRQEVNEYNGTVTPWEIAKYYNF